MKLIGLDFESHYSQEYSLRKMTTESYINDPQFQIIGVSVGVQGRKPQWYSLPTLDDYRQLLAPLMDHAIVCHNAPFDIGILSFRLGLHPRFTVDTLAMARTWYGNTVRNDLGAVAQRLGLPPKGNEIVNAKGKRLEDFTPEELAAFGGYCVHDTELTLAIFERLMADGYPSSELRRQDIVLRAFTQPTLRLDPEMLAAEYQQEQERKAALLDPLTGVSKDELMSNDKFAQVLLARGIEPPTKINAKGKRTYAFAKSDADFKALLDHEDEDVVALVEARLGVKSTQRETRAKRFIELGRRTGGWLPVPLASGRAHTLRLAGWDKINLQNLPRVNKKDPKTGLLRRAIVAPPGSLVCAGDLSQIEARLLAAAAGQTDKVEAFANKRDVYSEQASVIFNRHVDRKANPDDFVAGFIGKAVTLGCGYSMGHMKFAGMIYVGMLGEKGVLFDDAFAQQLGVDVREYVDWLSQREDRMENARRLQPLALTAVQWVTHLACAARIIKTFRDSNPMIEQYWGTCNRAIESMYRGVQFEFGGAQGNLFCTDRHGNTGMLLGPDGTRLLYPELEFDGDTYSCLRYKNNRVQRVKLYGGLVTENTTQYLAGRKIGDVMVDLDDGGYRVALQVHDEVACVVPAARAEQAKADMLASMRRRPAWMPDLPLEAEVGVSRSYGDAK